MDERSDLGWVTGGRPRATRRRHPAVRAGREGRRGARSDHAL